jgi:hypothetical protein
MSAAAAADTALVPAREHLELRADGEARRQQVVVGEKEDALARQDRESRMLQRTILEVHGTAVGLHQSAGNPQQRRLAGAVAPEQHADLPGLGAKCRGAQHATRPEGLCDAVGAQDGRHVSR